MIRYSALFSALSFAALLTLGACTETPIVPIATDGDIVATRIAAAAEKASASLDTIAGIEQNRNPLPPMTTFPDAPPNLAQPVTLRWTGPVEQVSRLLAERAGFQFVVKGTPPQAPITATVDVYEKPLVEILHDIGLQAGQRASMTLDAKSQILEIRYAPVDKI